MSLVVEVLAYLTLFTNIALISACLIYIAEKAGFGLSDNGYLIGLEAKISEYVREVAFLFAFTATSGSLYLSEVVGWTPCRLCWYQRIFMYPLVIILGVGILTGDENMKDYLLPTAMIGTAIAFVHSLIQRYEQFESAGCSVTAVSCATEHTFHFGYVTIPVMALTAFLAIIVLVWRFD